MLQFASVLFILPLPSNVCLVADASLPCLSLLTRVVVPLLFFLLSFLCSVGCYISLVVPLSLALIPSVVFFCVWSSLSQWSSLSHFPGVVVSHYRHFLVSAVVVVVDVACCCILHSVFLLYCNRCRPAVAHLFVCADLMTAAMNDDDDGMESFLFRVSPIFACVFACRSSQSLPFLLKSIPDAFVFGKIVSACCCLLGPFHLPCSSRFCRALTLTVSLFFFD